MGHHAPELWLHPELRAAAADGDFAALFRCWRKLTGISQTQLGQLVGLAQPAVSDIERGRRVITSSEVRERVRAGLEMPPGLARGRHGAEADSAFPVPGLRLPGLEPDPDLYERLTRTVTGSVAPDSVSLDWLERVLAEHRRTEDAVGSRPMIDLMRRQLDTVVGLHGAATGAAADRVVRLAAEHAQFLGWLAQDQDALSASLRWHDRAHAWALEAGDANMAATTLSMRAHLAWSIGQGPRCVRLAEAARWSAPGASVGVQGQAAQMAARGHAVNGAGRDAREAEAARRLLDEARVLIRRAADQPGDEPPWMYFYDETWFSLQEGMAELHLGNWGRAVERLGAGLVALPESYRRDRAWYRACLARAYASAGEADEALRTAVRCLPDAAAVGRAHSWDELHGTASVLMRRGAAEARTLVDMLRVYD